MMEIPEVKNGIIDEIARYLSWEVTVLMGGRHPCRGFYDEDLGGNEEYIADGVPGNLYRIQGRQEE